MSLSSSDRETHPGAAGGASPTPEGQNAQSDAALIFAARFLRHRSGPLPDPETLAQYERVLPGTAERILLQFEEQSRHRMAVEQRAVQSDTFSQMWSTIAGSLLALCAVAGGILLAWSGHYASGLSMFFATLFTFLGTFVAGKRAQAADFDAKKTRQQLLQNAVSQRSKTSSENRSSQP